MTRMSRLLLILCSLLLVACAGKKPMDLTAFHAHPPRSILVVPVVNESTELSAPGTALATLSAPLAERGYYVFPTYLTDMILRDFGLSEAGHIHQLPSQRFYDLFGADAVLFVTIKDWSSKYIVVSSSVVVSMEYLLKDTRTGTILWEGKQKAVHNSGGGAGGGLAGLIVMAVDAALTAAAVDYLPLARAANATVFQTAEGLPPGPYHRDYGKKVSP